MVKTGNGIKDLEEVRAYLFVVKGNSKSKINIDAIELRSDKSLECIRDAVKPDVPEGTFSFLMEGFEYKSNDELMSIYLHRTVWTNKASLAYSLESIDIEQPCSTAAALGPIMCKMSLGLVYTPSSNDSWVVLQRRFSLAKDWSNIKGIGFWLYGDNSYNEITLIFRDADNEAWQIPWIQLGWSGWRRFYYDFNDLTRDPYDSVKNVTSKKDFDKVKSMLIVMRGGVKSNIYLNAISLISLSPINQSEKIGLQTVSSINKIYLYWDDSSNPFISKYLIYRDGEMIGYSYNPFYIDADLPPANEHTYQVSAYFSNGREGEKSVSRVCSSKPKPSLSSNVKVDKDWLVVNGEKFFVKGIGYSPFRPYCDPRYDNPAPLDALEDDMRLIKDAGFNTLRTWDAMDERQLIMAEKYGLMVMQGLSIDPKGDFNNPEFVKNSLKAVEEKVKWSKDHDNVLCYMLINEPDVQTVLKSGVESVSSLFNNGAKTVRNIDSNKPISASLWVPTDFLDTSMLDFVCFNIYRYDSPMITQDMGYDNYINWLKKKHAQNKPLIISEFGYSVSPLGPGNYGYGGNTADAQKEGIINDIKQIIGAGATGFCVFEWIDEWWKNFDYESDANKHDSNDPEEWFGILGILDDKSSIQGEPRPAYYGLKNILTNFDVFYKDAVNSTGFNKDFILDIGTDKTKYISSEAINIVFTLMDGQRMPLRSAPITYTIRDKRNSIQTVGKVNTDKDGKVYFSYISLPGSKSTVLSISVGARLSNGLKAVNLKHIFIEEDMKYALKKRHAKMVKTSKPPQIDGVFDNAWKDANPMLLKGDVDNIVQARMGNWVGESGLSAKVYMLWDEANIYIFGDIVDEFPCINNNKDSGLWDGDALEIFLSTGPDKIPETGYSPDDFQVILGSNEKMWIYGQAAGGARNQEPKDSKIIVKKHEKGYTIEAKISLNNFNNPKFEAGKILGFDLALDDADKTQKREAQLVWSGLPNNYENSKYWGRCTLIDISKNKKGVLRGIWEIFKR
ncbi:MAG: hypothetical protein AUJ70_04915 [Candidatus Omnitrophica bacterium CG1_02_40_15]|nr:MAG: hypothetical protein AUJ70_04915 [Candidatus Omnitrophica bacterium CG1_02_40_15]